ncbi:MAG: hypothetical protein AAGC60_24160 [Acidobacteriota bacterium]
MITSADTRHWSRIHDRRRATVILGSMFALSAVLLFGVGCGDDQRAEWRRTLPAAEAPAVGTPVWTLVVDDEAAEPPPARFVRRTVGAPTAAEAEGMADDEVMLIDALDRRQVVPAALVHPVAHGTPESGEVVLVARDGRAAVGRRVGDGVALDHNGATRVVPVDDAASWPPGGSLDALPRRVVFAEVDLVDVSEGAVVSAGPLRSGVAMAATAEWVWVLDDGGFLHRVERAVVEPVEPVSIDAEGEVAVRTVSWADGVRAGVVVAEVEPALRYAVRSGLAGDGAESVYWFADLAAR